MISAAPQTITRGLKQRSAKTLPGAIALFSRFAVPRIFVATLLVALPLRVWLGSVSLIDGLLLGAIGLYWPFQEWLFHNYLLHWVPKTLGGLKVDPWFARVHRWHHRHPDVLERVFLPTGFIALASPVHWLVWLAVLPTPQAVTGIVGFTAAALVYEWVHYLVHTPYKPRSAWFGTVRRNHMLHHFKNEHYWHAFTVPWVDRVFGTDPDPSTVPQSQTCRTLGVDDEPLTNVTAM